MQNKGLPIATLGTQALQVLTKSLYVIFNQDSNLYNPNATFPD